MSNLVFRIWNEFDMLKAVLSFQNMASYCNIDFFSYYTSRALDSVFHVLVPTVWMIRSDVSLTSFSSVEWRLWETEEEKELNKMLSCI